jgi:type I restriction enzyme, S subunit
MKKEWQTKKLGEICATIQDGAHESPQKQFDSPGEGRFLYITSKNIRTNYLELKNVSYVEKDFHDRIYPRCSPRVGDVLLTKDGANTGNVALNTIDEPFSLLSSVCLIKTNPTALNSGFLCYYLQSPEGLNSIIGQMTGAAIKRIILRDVKLATIPLPPLAEQQRIVGLLDEAFEGLATAKANAEINLQNARALFESHLQSVFTHRGPGWVEKRLGDEALLEIIDGDRGVNYPNGSDFQDEGYCLFMNTKNVRPDGFEFESTMFITEEKDRLLRKGKLKRDDVVLTTRGTIGNVGIYSEDVPFDNIRINSGMLIFRPNKSTLLPEFLFELFRSEIVKGQIRKQTTGAAQPQLPIKTLVNFTIPVPSKLADQAALVKKLRAFEPETQRLAQLYERKLAALEALKKSLLHQAFTGAL